MATSQPGSSSSAHIADNRIFLFRLQMLIIDGGLTSLRNFVAQELAAQSSTLSACLANEKTQINLLKGRKIITQVQYDLLYPSSGTVSTSDLDITLIICLMRSLKCFKLNTQFNWNTPPAKNDISIEADICRLKFFRNEICHISTTKGIQHNDFIQKWNEIEQILLRIDTVYPIKDFQQTINEFQFNTIDPSTEKRVTDEIEKWNKFDKSVTLDLEHLKQSIEAQNIELADTRKCTSENTEELKTVNVKIAKIENQLPTVDNYQKRELSQGNATQAKKRKAKKLYQVKKKGALVAIKRKKTFQIDGNVVVTAKWVLKSYDGDDRKLAIFDEMFIALFKGRKKCSIDEHKYKVLLEKLRDLVSFIEQTTGAKAIDAETSCVIVKFICRTNKHIKNLLEYFDSDDLERRLNEIANLISHHAKIQVNLSFKISDESLDSILQTEVAGKTEEVKKTSLSDTIKDQMKKTGSEPDSHILSTEDTYLIRPEAGTELRSHISSTEDTYLIRKEELKESLIIFNKCSHSIILLPPLFEKDYTPLASFYIKPELNVNTLQDMFQTGYVANREIYLKADAGLGKTTFSKYLATSWCQAHCPDKKDVLFFEKNDIDCMRDFDFVFLVLLRDSNTSCSVDELIFKLIVSNLANSKSFTEELMQELLSREKCLVILDGLDEWTHPNTQCERAPRSVPHRNIRENCTILTTTRPWKLGELNLSSNELGTTAELIELSRDSAETLIRRTLLRLKSPPHNMSIEIDDATLVNEIFSSRVAHLANVPLLLMYMICLRCEGFNIGNSKCELYVKIVELLLLRTTQKYRDISQTLSSRRIPACFADHYKCKEYFPLLVNLGQLAYHTLSNKTRVNTLAFDGSVTEKYLTPEEMKFTLHSGILSQNTTKYLTKKVSKVSFSHKTVQEFFAVIFISSENEAQKTVVEKCSTIQDILDMLEIWEFIIEMNPDRMCEIANDLMSVINEDEETCDYRTRTGCEDICDTPLYNIQKMFMSCLQEMPEGENIQLCLQDFFIDRRTEHSVQLQRLSKQNKTNIKSLYINISYTSMSLREIIDLFSLTDLSHIQKLYYIGNMKEAEINRILFPSLQNVYMGCCKWTKGGENLSENLMRVQNIQYLHIDRFKLSHKILEIFLIFISSQKSMKELTLQWVECAIFWTFRHVCKIQNLDLSQHSTLSKLHLLLTPGRLSLKIAVPSSFNLRYDGIKYNFTRHVEY